MGCLRLLLALSVLIAHSRPDFLGPFVDGTTAVQVFFIISGFYMALILNEKYVAGMTRLRQHLARKALSRLAQNTHNKVDIS